MAAPVVPMMEARAVPMASRRVLSLAEPCKLPHTRMPPEMVYKASSSRIRDVFANHGMGDEVQALVCAKGERERDKEQ